MFSDPADDALLVSYAEKFYGYGSYDAPFWFVGMEEGGGDDLEKVRARLHAWETRGRRELEDLAEFHRAFGEGRWFDGTRPPTQRTWRSLIRILLAAEGRDLSLESVRRYQTERLGRLDGATAILELLPLPSPSIEHWKYGEWSSLAPLGGRASYRDYYAPRRADYLRRKVEEHGPVAVVYYCLDGKYQRWWALVSGVQFQDRKVEGQRLRFGTDGQTVFVVIPHPNTRGVTSEFCHSVGRSIEDMRKQQRCRHGNQRTEVE